jgi:isochorismate synthase EntC
MINNSLINSINQGVIFSDPTHVAFGTGEVTTLFVAVEDLERKVSKLLVESRGLFILLPFDYRESAVVVVPATFNLLQGDYSSKLSSLSKKITPNGLGYELSATESSKDWAYRVSKVIDEIRYGKSGLIKTVLSREILVKRQEDLIKTGVLSRLAANFPTTQIFSVGSIIGASPEVVARVSNSIFTSCLLAGTAPRSVLPQVDAQIAMDLENSKKNLHEHDLCKNHMLKMLKNVVDNLSYSPKPEVLSFKNVHHLATRFTGDVPNKSSLLSITLKCHRSPAIVGEPVDLANSWISKNEPHQRKYYSGAVGWMNQKGEGQFALAIRCVEVNKNEARLLVGNGIVASSDLDAELAELEAKADFVLGAVTSL